VALKSIACIDDLRRLAHRKVPREFMDYYESGSYSEATLRANRDDLKKIRINQRILAGASDRDLSQTVLGQPQPLPLALGRVVCVSLPFRSSTCDASIKALTAKADPLSRWHHEQWQQCTNNGLAFRR